MESSDRLTGTPSKRAFAELIMKGLKSAGDRRTVKFCDEPYSLTFEDESSGCVNLENMYAEHCHMDGKERPNHIKRVLLALIQAEYKLPEEFEDAKPDLRPKIWTRATFAQMKLDAQIHGQKSLDLPLIPVADHLLLGLVFDLPTSMRSVSTENLVTWNVTIYEAMEAAKQNLLESGFSLASLGDRVYASVNGDHYDCCRLLATDMIRNLSLTGDPIAMVPNRDTLFIAGSDDPEGLEMMADLTEKSLEEPRPMMSTALRLDGDEWVDWLPPANHPAHRRFKLMKLYCMLGLYDAQKEQLERLHEQNHTDLFVASLTAVKNDQGDVWSYCVWSESVDSWLPESDVVFFFRPEQEMHLQVAWTDVVRIVGHLMEQIEDLYPPRFQVRDFPSHEQLTMLTQHSLP